MAADVAGVLQDTRLLTASCSAASSCPNAASSATSSDPRLPGKSLVSFISLLGGTHPSRVSAAHYRSEARRFSNEDDRSPTFSSHMTGGLWQ